MIARDRRSVESYRRDARFHSIAASIVAHELDKHGRIDPDNADREAYDIATAVAAKLLQTIYEEDAELSAQKAIADQYRKLAERALMVSPVPPILVQSPRVGSER